MAALGHNRSVACVRFAPKADTAYGVQVGARWRRPVRSSLAYACDPRLQNNHAGGLARFQQAVVPKGVAGSEGSAISIFATLIGALQLARAVDNVELSDRILVLGADAARVLAQARTAFHRKYRALSAAA
jgi:hypothetical protein